MAQWVRNRLLWVSATVLSLSAVLVFGDVPGWWLMLTGEQENGLLRFLDRGDKLFGIVSGIVTVTMLVFSVRQTRKSGAVPDQQTAATRVRQLVGVFVDRRAESHQLRRALTDRRTRVILVHGRVGVGKTELVHRVLGKTGIDHVWNTANPTFPLTIAAILRGLNADDNSFHEPDPHSDETPIGHLEAVLRNRGTKRHVIVFDSVEHMLNDDRQLTDLSLDEALELIATGPRHGVKIVLITERKPVAAAGGKWVGEACVIPVGGLPLEHFRKFVAESAAGRRDLLASLDDRILAEVRQDLGGRPRLAQLFDAIIECDTGMTAEDLASDLHAWARTDSVDQVCDRLRRTMTAAFRPDRRRVYRAVAAFATPVDVATVAALANEGRERDDRLSVDGVRSELTELSRHAILTDRDKRVFFLPPAEARRVLEWKTETDLDTLKTNRRLLASAAEALRQRRKMDRDGDWADPQASLAEVDAWLNADLPDAAFRSIEEIDTGAAVGSPAMLFRKPRHDIAQRIPSTERPANYNVLGYLFHASGDYMRAKDAYRCALEEIPDDRPVWNAKILVNLAGLEWAQGYVEMAFADFKRAHRLAQNDEAVTAGALTGMARCRRREGQFAAAAAHLVEALSISKSQPGRMIPIAVRLARLHIESDRLREAENLIGQVRDGAEQAGDTSLQAAYHDVLADLRLAQGRWDDAMSAAHEAVRLALSVHDPVTALQARSTSCVARMRRGQFRRAAREATLARRYGGTDSLIVIALQGVSYRRAERPADSRRAFDELLEHATTRTDRYERDFAAWTLRGVALCAQALDTGAPSMRPAVAVFQQARRHNAEPAPTLAKLMLFLIETMATDEVEHRQLQPVRANLERVLAAHSRA